MRLFRWLLQGGDEIVKVAVFFGDATIQVAVLGFRGECNYSGGSVKVGMRLFGWQRKGWDETIWLAI